MPTVYIVSYSRNAMRRDGPRAQQRLNRACPEEAHYIDTLDCLDWIPPPPEICEQYSGVTRRVQEYVMRDPEAVAGVDRGVRAVIRALDRGHRTVVLFTVCVAGTHRSVSAAEIIGRELRSIGVRVFVRHPFRRRRPGDHR